MWRRDGAGWRARIGLLTPHFDPVPETEFQAMALPGVSIHAARVPLGTFDSDGNFSLNVARARPVRLRSLPTSITAQRFASIPASVIVCAYTGSSYVLGADGDDALKARLETRTRGSIVSPMPTCCLALRALGARRSLIHPPWFSADLDESGVTYFLNRGFEAVHHAPAPLRSDFGEVAPAQIYDWLRTVPASARRWSLERQWSARHWRDRGTGAGCRPAVLSANQVAFWLHLAGIEASVGNYGRYSPPAFPPAHGALR